MADEHLLSIGFLHKAGGEQSFEAAADRVVAAGGRATRSTEKTTSATQELQRRFGEYQRFTSPAVVGVAALTTGLVAYFAAIQRGLRFSTDFQAQLIAVGKTTDIQGQALRSLGDELDRLSRSPSMPVATAGLLEIAQAAGQLGVEGSENILEYTRTVALLGTASDLSGEQAATALARIQNVTGEASSEVDVLASVIVALGNNFAATESQIAHHTGEVARATAVFDIGSAAAAALATTMAAVGVRAELSGSAVGRSFRTIESAVKGGGSALESLAKVSRASAEDISEAFRRSPVEAFNLLLQGLRQTQLEGGNVAAELAEIGLKGEEILKVIPVLAKEFDLLAEAQAIAARETEDATALTEEASRSSASLASQYQVLSNQVESTLRLFGDKLVPVVTDIVKRSQEWIESNRELIEILGSLTAGGVQALSAAVGFLVGSFEGLTLVVATLVGVRLVPWLAATTTGANLLALANTNLATAVSLVRAGYLKLIAVDIAASFRAGAGGAAMMLKSINPLVAALVALGAASIAANSAIKRWADRSAADIARLVGVGEGAARIIDGVNRAIESADLDTMRNALEGLSSQIADANRRQIEIKSSLSDLVVEQEKYQNLVSLGGRAAVEYGGQLADVNRRIDEQSGALADVQEELRVAEQMSGQLETAYSNLAETTRRVNEEQGNAASQLAAVSGSLADLRAEVLVQQSVVDVMEKFGLSVSEAEKVVATLLQSEEGVSETALQAANRLQQMLSISETGTVNTVVDLVEQLTTAQEAAQNLESRVESATSRIARARILLALAGREDTPVEVPIPDAGPPIEIDLNRVTAERTEQLERQKRLAEQQVESWMRIGAVITGIISDAGLGFEDLFNNLFRAVEAFGAQFQSAMSGDIAGAIAAGAEGGESVFRILSSFGIGEGDRGRGRLGGRLSGDFADIGAQVGGAAFGPIGAIGGTVIGSLIKRGADEALAGVSQVGDDLVARIDKVEGDLGPALKSLVGGIIGTIESIEGFIGSEIGVGEFSVKIRDDVVKVFVAGIEQAFEGEGAVQQAVSFAVSELMKTAVLDPSVGQNVRQALQSGAGFESLEELDEVLRLARALDQGVEAAGDLSQKIIDLNNQRKREIELAEKHGLAVDEVLRISQQRADALGAEAGGQLIDLLQQIRGEGFLAAEQQELQHTLTMLQLASQIAAVETLLATTDALGDATRGVLQGIVDAANETLENLEAGTITLRRPGAGAGRRRRADQREEFFRDLVRLEQSLGGVADSTLDLLDALEGISEATAAAAALGVKEEALARFRQAQIDALTRDFSDPFRESLQQSDESPLQTEIRHLQEQMDEALEQAFNLALARTREFGTSIDDEFQALAKDVRASFRDLMVQAIEGSVQQELDEFRGVGGFADQIRDLSRRFDEARDALRGVGLSSEELSRRLRELDSAERLAASGIATDLIGSFQQLGVNLPVGLLERMNELQFERNRMMAIENALVFEREVGFASIGTTLEEILDRIADAAFAVEEEIQSPRSQPRTLVRPRVVVESQQQFEAVADSIVDLTAVIDRWRSSINTLSDSARELIADFERVDEELIGTFQPIFGSNLGPRDIEGLLAGIQSSLGPGVSAQEILDDPRLFSLLAQEFRLVKPNPTPNDLANLDLLRENLELLAQLAESEEAFNAARQDMITDLISGLSPATSTIESQFVALTSRIDDAREAMVLLGASAEQMAEFEANAAEAVAQFWDDALSPLRDIQEELQGGSFGGLSPQASLAQSRERFDRLAEAARGGDFSAVQQLPAAINDLLEQRRSFSGSGGAFIALQREIDELLASLLVTLPGGAQVGAPAPAALPPQSPTGLLLPSPVGSAPAVTGALSPFDLQAFSEALSIDRQERSQSEEGLSERVEALTEQVGDMTERLDELVSSVERMVDLVGERVRR